MTTSSLQHYIAPELQALLGLDMMTDEERHAYIQSIETLILEAALLRYAGMVTEDELSVLESWLLAHTNQTNVMMGLEKTFPDFFTVIKTEIERFLRLDPSHSKASANAPLRSE